jgi:hypothetical protein
MTHFKQYWVRPLLRSANQNRFWVKTVSHPPKPPVNIVTYGRIAKHFVVARTD